MSDKITPDDDQHLEADEELNPNVFTSKIVLSSDDFDFIERLNDIEPPKLDWLKSRS